MDENYLLEQRIRKIAEQVYDDRGTKSKYQVSNVPFHTHNGTDSSQINEKDIIHSVRNYTRLVVDSDETFTLRNVPNISTLQLQGFGANNADGSPATERVIVNGTAKFGRCYAFEGSGSSISITSNVQGIPFIQSSNSMYTRVTGSGMTLSVANRVSVAPFLAYSTDGTNDLFTLSIDTYSNGLITMTVSLHTNWKLQVDLILS